MLNQKSQYARKKLDQVIFVHPAAPDKPGKPGEKPFKEEKVLDYYELWGGYLAETASYYINPDVSLVTEGNLIAAVNDAELFSYAGTTKKDGMRKIGRIRYPGSSLPLGTILQ